MVERTLSFRLYRAAMAYDFEGGVAKLRKRFPRMGVPVEVNTKTDHALAYEYSPSELLIDIMGTSGETFQEKIAAWRRNFEIDAGPDGLPYGFSSSAKTILNEIDIDFNHYSTIDITGHSAGSSIAAAVAVRLLQATKRPDIYTYGFAGPPDGNYRIERFYQSYRSRWEAIKIVNPRDIVTTMFRSQEDDETRGVDIGRIVTLPPDTLLQRWLYKWFKRFPSFLEHSPREYCDGMVKYAKKNNPFPREEVKFLRRVRRDMVN